MIFVTTFKWMKYLSTDQWHVGSTIGELKAVKSWSVSLNFLRQFEVRAPETVEYLPQGMERVRLMMFWAKLTTSCLNACDWERKLKFLPELKTSAQLCLS